MEVAEAMTAMEHLNHLTLARTFLKVFYEANTHIKFQIRLSLKTKVEI